MATALPIDDPKATTKHTISGYGWSDVTNALIRSVGNADMECAIRWSAELVCSDLGLGRLEAVLLDAWAMHIGGAYATWPKIWHDSIQQLRTYWTRSGGDIRAVRNTPAVRQYVAEAVAALVLSAKKPLPTLPTSSDCFREAETIRNRIRSGKGVSDQPSTRRVWIAGQDSSDLRAIGNELEVVLCTNQTPKLLFWIIWFITLDSQSDAPQTKLRGPEHLTPKQRKSLLWFLVAILKDIANESAFLSVEDRNKLFGVLEFTWNKLGIKGRRNILVALAISLQDHLTRRHTLSLSGTPSPPNMNDIRRAIIHIDSVYSGIAEEARRFQLERPQIVGLTPDSAVQTRRLAAVDKLSLSFMLAK